MKGHIRERSPSHWSIVLDVPYPKTGKRKRWHRFVGTKRQAQVRCAELITELQGGGGIDPARVTVAACLDRWLDHIRPQVTPKTYERYASLVRANIKRR